MRTVLVSLVTAAFLLLGVAATGGVNGTLSADISYGDLPRQKLDVYTPTATTGSSRPVIVFFYGGGWEIGRRERYRFIATALNGEDAVVVIPDYRVYPDAVFPDFVFDAAKAVAWTRSHIARFGGDPKRIFVMGHSAGAHIAAMLALDGKYLASVGMERKDLRGMIGLAGPYDFLPLAPGKQEFIFGSEAERWRSQPINFVDGANPPMLLLTGDRDSVVPPGNTRRLAAKIRTNRGPVVAIEFSGMDHAELLSALASRWRGDVLATVTSFMRQH